MVPSVRQSLEQDIARKVESNAPKSVNVGEFFVEEKQVSFRLE